jgi:sigma-B regulation protein RsbU (phosphoserine phosphatase)
MGREPCFSAWAQNCCGWWDLETGILLYANAGHDPPWHMTPDGALEELWPTGAALGIEDKLELEDEQREIAVGTTLVVYTDGLTSQRVPGGERLGDAGGQELARRHVGESCAALAEKLLFPAPTLEDDIVLITFRRSA